MLVSDGIVIITIPNGYGTYENFERLHKFLKTTMFARMMTRLKMLLISGGLFLEQKPRQDDDSIPCPHMYFITLGKFKKVLAAANLSITKKRNGHFVLDSLPGNILYRIDKNLIFVDGWLSRFFPAFLVNSWFFICKRRS